MSLTDFAIQVSLFLFALILLFINLRTKKKNYFLLSIGMITLASLISFLQNIGSTISLFFFLAMIVSFLGDLFMAQKIKITNDRIINGIIAFAIAHISYIYVFSLLSTVSWELWHTALAIFLLLLIYFTVVYDKNTSRYLLIASFLYSGIITILFINVLRFTFTLNLPILAIIFSMVGIILFLISDSVLAYNEFKNKLKNADQIISLTYVFSQILLQSTQLALM